jgi:hypothetical protein
VLDSIDDSTTVRTPFGANSGPPVYGASVTLSMTKQLLIANKTGEPSFSDLCERVSGKPAPEAVNFSASPQARQPKATDPKPDPSAAQQ